MDGNQTGEDPAANTKGDTLSETPSEPTVKQTEITKTSQQEADPKPGATRELRKEFRVLR
jgi:hypothetical protein